MGIPVLTSTQQIAFSGSVCNEMQLVSIFFKSLCLSLDNRPYIPAQIGSEHLVGGAYLPVLLALNVYHISCAFLQCRDGVQQWVCFLPAEAASTRCKKGSR